ncbi:MAG: DNA-formamidopyrimidine glycosylase family protein, partial [Gammaproteobacteria bacterium]
MPELPDLTIYLEHLNRRIKGERLCGIRLASPFVLRTVEPRVDELVGREVLGVERLAKRIVIELQDERFIVIHLMISGRLHWKERGVAVPRRNGLSAFDFESGTMTFTEASKKKRASIHLVRGRDGLSAYDPGGVEVLTSSLEEFRAAITRHNHTLKRALTDQHILAGIGNAYSDEILLRARLSPFKQVRSLDSDEIE